MRGTKGGARERPEERPSGVWGTQKLPGCQLPGVQLQLLTISGRCWKAHEQTEGPQRPGLLWGRDAQEKVAFRNLCQP